MSGDTDGISSKVGRFIIRVVGVALLAALAPTPAFSREPTEFEQYMIELVNRARMNPEAEVGRLDTGSLNEGPPTLGGFPYTIPSGPKQPLAVNLHIVDAASDYAQAMNDDDTFCHDCLGTNSATRMWAAGYVSALADFDFFEIAGYTLAYGGAQDPACSSGCPIFVPGRENLSFQSEGPPDGRIDDLLFEIADSHEGLFNDFRIPSRGHRSTMLYGEWREIGIGMSEGQDGNGSSDSLYLVQNFAHRSDKGPFLTGVAYDDVDENGFYTPGTGEALGGVAVTVYDAGTQDVAGSTTTMTAGGYNVDLEIGLYDVVVTGFGIDQTHRNIAILGSGPSGIGENTKLDFVSLPEPATALGMAASLLALGSLRRAHKA